MSLIEFYSPHSFYSITPRASTEDDLRDEDELSDDVYVAPQFKDHSSDRSPLFQSGKMSLGLATWFASGPWKKNFDKMTFWKLVFFLLQDMRKKILLPKIRIPSRWRLWRSIAFSQLNGTREKGPFFMIRIFCFTYSGILPLSQQRDPSASNASFNVPLLDKPSSDLHYTWFKLTDFRLPINSALLNN